MSKIEVILKKPLKGKKAGEQVTMSWAHAKALIAIGHAEKVGESAPPEPGKPVIAKKPATKKPAAKKPATAKRSKPQTE